MEKLQMVEKLQQRAEVSSEEAKAILEACDWDLLDALILLEREGRVTNPAARVSSAPEEPCCSRSTAEKGCRRDRDAKDGCMKRLKALLCKLFRKGMSNRFVVRRRGEVLLDLPVLVSVVLMILFFWLTIILLIVGLFTDCEYSFSGDELGRDSINNGIRKATDAAVNFADRFRNQQN